MKNKQKEEEFKLTKDSSVEDIRDYLSDNYEDDLQEAAGYDGAETDTDFGVIKYVGREGFSADGETCTEVFSYLGRYFGVPYTYSSWDSSDFELDSMFEVKPVQVEVTKWEKI